MFKNIVFSSLLLTLVVCLSFTVFGHEADSTLLEDVNNDGTVDIRDLVLVATVLGQPGDRTSDQNPDVNRDGTVDVLDLRRVVNRFGETEQGDNSTYHDIQD
ncbi:hypothetical protein F4083_04080, partial [Candidatus Poribacteria bacterium]|nr:hypothetical protein [Candidatus Poribacteria bacterium]